MKHPVPEARAQVCCSLRSGLDDFVVQLVRLLPLVLGILGVAGQARAYTEPRTYLQPANEGGGGGRFFTGSPAEGYACGVCHVSEQRAQLELRGLPENGYVPGVTYDLRLTWPEFAKRAEQLRARDEGPPSMSLVTELVAESGEGSGVLEIPGGRLATKDELCTLPEGQQGAVLFALRPGVETAESGTRCEASKLGQRCVAAVLSCGVRELHLKWTAPKSWQGAIWMSAGLVTTDKVSGDPKGDAVNELKRVVLPAASESARYQSELRGGCAAGPPRRSGHGAWSALLAASFALGLAYRRRRGAR